MKFGTETGENVFCLLFCYAHNKNEEYACSYHVITTVIVSLGRSQPKCTAILEVDSIYNATNAELLVKLSGKNH